MKSAWTLCPTARCAGTRTRRVIALAAACLWVGTSLNAAELQLPAAEDATSLAATPIIDLDFLNITGATVPDKSGNANYGLGKKGAVGLETSWSPGTALDSQGKAAVSCFGRVGGSAPLPRKNGANVNRATALSTNSAVSPCSSRNLTTT